MDDVSLVAYVASVGNIVLSDVHQSPPPLEGDRSNKFLCLFNLVMLKTIMIDLDALLVLFCMQIEFSWQHNQMQPDDNLKPCQSAF